MINSNKFKTAFTLVELSIVLLIIGLIIGGITAGSSLIKQSQLRAVMSEVNNLKSAINAFKIQFTSLPGDMSNASTFWPTCDATPSNCNGNSNGLIEYTVNAGNNNNTTNKNESYRAWQQLVSAGLLNGNYSGVATTASQSDIGINVPASKYANGGYTIVEFGGGVNDTFTFGRASASSYTHTDILIPADAYNIDSKIDDGNPATGIVLGYNGEASCMVAGTPYVYNLANATPGCSTHFLFQ
jgi:prepilin-type N-terminal cleavage/methylation domain-containing protein